MSEEYSEQQARAVRATAEAWYEVFAQSPAFARLNDSEQRKAGAIIAFFARHAYDALGVAPEAWDRGAVVDCCTEILPRKVSAERSFFEAVAPVLSAFFTFLEDQSLLPNARALSELVEALHDDILSAAEDQSRWGPAKRFVMAAHDAGVDIQDPLALQAYALQFNLRQAARFAAAESDPPRPAAHAPRSKAPDSRSFVGPYDPCPCGSGRKYKFCCRQNG